MVTVKLVNKGAGYVCPVLISELSIMEALAVENQYVYPDPGPHVETRGRRTLQQKTGSPLEYTGIVLRLYPTQDQVRSLGATLGATRYVYNRYLKQRLAQHDRGRTLRYARCSKRLTTLKTKPGHEWLREVDAPALQQALIDLDRAWKRYLKAKSSLPRKRVPGCRAGFRCVTGLDLDVLDHRVRIGKCGWVRARGAWSRVPYGARMQAITVRQEGQSWYASILFRRARTTLPRATNPICGIDLGAVRPIQVCGVTKDGEEVSAVLGLGMRERMRKLRIREERYRKAWKRKARSSRNSLKAKGRLTRIQARIDRKRLAFAHGASAYLARTYRTIAVERLFSVDSKKSGTFSSLIRAPMAKLGLSQFLVLLERKVKMRKGEVVYVSPFNTSQTCSACGHTEKKNRKTRDAFECQACGHRDHADLNAARNILLKVA